MLNPIVLDGLVNFDAYVAGGVAVDCCNEGVALSHPNWGRTFVPTGRTPEPGCTVTTRHLPPRLFGGPLIGPCLPAGGALGAAVALARCVRGPPGGGAGQLLNSGHPFPELAVLCAREGVSCLSLGRQATPRNLVLHPPDFRHRAVVRSAVAAPAGGLTDGQREDVCRRAREAAAVASVSSR